MIKEPLKDKTYMRDNGGFSLLIAKFPDFEKRRKNSFSYTNDIKSAVEWFKEELHKNTDAKLRTSLFQVSDIIKLIDEAFPDLYEQELKNE